MSSVPRDRIHIQHQILTLAAQPRTRMGGEKTAQGPVLGLDNQFCTWPSRWSIFPPGTRYTGTGRRIWEGIMMMQFDTSGGQVCSSCLKTNKNNPNTNCSVLVVSPATNTHLTGIKVLFSLHKHPVATRVCLQRETLQVHLLLYQIPHRVTIFLCLLWSLPKGDHVNAGGAGWNSQSCSVGKEEVLCSSLALLSRCRNRSAKALGVPLVSHSIYTIMWGFFRDFFQMLYMSCCIFPSLSTCSVNSPFHLQNQHAGLLHNTG